MSIREPEHRTRARQACRVANDLSLELVTATNAYWTLKNLLERAPAGDVVQIGVNRMAVFYVIVTLSKWLEFYDRFKSVLPATVKQAAKALRAEISDRRIKEFRDKIGAHIWDKDTDRPLTGNEIEIRIGEIADGDISGFMRWANDPRNPLSPSVIMERVKEEIKARYDFEYAELDEV